MFIVSCLVGYLEENSEQSSSLIQSCRRLLIQNSDIWPSLIIFSKVTLENSKLMFITNGDEKILTWLLHVFRWCHRCLRYLPTPFVLDA